MGNLRHWKFVLLINLALTLLDGVVAWRRERYNGDECSVRISNGEIVGRIRQLKDSPKSVCAYQGIPYAAPPLGQLRFKAPEPPQRWRGRLQATREADWCPQPEEYIWVNGSTTNEDCLYLNVYVPRGTATNANLPVMIWIHGGGFFYGSSQEYQPDRLMARDKEIILVSMQYRLGYLGFFSTGDAIASGNWGLKDQQHSIRWVSENIQNFGGNPNQVTIFGQSAGSASVSHQFISPLNRNLIHGAISQSGASTAFWAIDKDPRASAIRTGRRLGCNQRTSSALVECMRGKEVHEFLEAYEQYTNESWTNWKYPIESVIPVVEVQNAPRPFITREPIDILRSGDFPDIPYIMGSTKHDGSFFLGEIYTHRIGPRGHDKDPWFMRHEFMQNHVECFGNQEHLPGRTVSSTFEMAFLDGVNRTIWDAAMPGLVDVTTIGFMKSPILNKAEWLSYHNRTVYLYSFEHHSHLTTNPFYGSGIPVNGGIAHSDDLIYHWNYPSNPKNMSLSERDEEFADMFCDMWLNFGTYGNPTPPQKDNGRVVEWPIYHWTTEQYMKLNITSTVHTNYYSSWRPASFEWF